MPFKCVVPGCRSNYYHVKGTKSIPMMKFPQEPDMIQKWCDAIARSDFVPSTHSHVCIKHFDDSQLLKYESIRQADGSLERRQRRHAKLVVGAVPCVFEVDPSTHKMKPPHPRRLQKLEEKKLGSVKMEKEEFRSAACEILTGYQVQAKIKKDEKESEKLILIKRKRGRPRKQQTLHPLWEQQPKVDLRKFRRYFETRKPHKGISGKRGRPRKFPLGVQFKPEMFKDDQAGCKEDPPVVKRGRGRPRKHPISEKTSTYKSDGSSIKFEGTSCAALACTNTSDTSILYPLPEDPSLRQKWVEKIDRLDWTPDVDSTICNVHFDEDMWESGGSGDNRRLKKDAVPSLFLHGEAIKSWVTMDNSGNVLLENHIQGDVGIEYEQDNLSEDNDPDLYVKREALEPEIDMVEGSEDVLSQEPDSTEEGFETIYCDSTYNDQDVELVPEPRNPFDQESYHSNSFSDGSDSERNLRIQEDEVTCLDNNNAMRPKESRRENNSSNFFVISKSNSFKIKTKKRRNSDQLTREFECKICCKRLSRRKNLEIHMEKLHPNKDHSNIEGKDQDGKENQNILKTCLLGKKPPPPLAPLLPSCLLASPPPMALPSISPITAPTLMATPIVTSTMVSTPGAKDPSPTGGEMKKQFLLLLPQPPPPSTISPLPAEQSLVSKINVGDYFVNLNQVPLEKRDSLKAKIKELVEAVSAKDLDPNRIIIAYDRT